MKLLVVGAVPPPATEFSEALGMLAALALADGAVVDVLSPDLRSAAHLHANLSGLRLALQLARTSCQYDALVLRVQDGVPLDANSSRKSRTIALVSLGLALSLWRDVTLHFDSPIPLPGGVGGRATRLFWRSASRIVVANAHDRSEIEKVPGIAPEAIEVLDNVGSTVTVPSRSWSSLGEEPSREAVLGAIRLRAADHRAINDSRVDLGHPPNGPVTDAIFADDDLPKMRVGGVVRIGWKRVTRILGRLLAA